MLEGKLLIGRKWKTSDRKFESLNHATGDVIGRACLAGCEEVTEAVKEAKLAQISWKNTDISERAGILAMIGDEILKRSHDLKTLITIEIREFVSVKHVNINSGTDKTRSWWFPYGK